MSTIERYQCGEFREICPFNNGHLREILSREMSYTLPSCDGRLVDYIHVQSFCEPFNGVPIGNIPRNYIESLIEILGNNYTALIHQAVSNLRSRYRSEGTDIPKTVIDGGLEFARMIHASSGIIGSIERSFREYNGRFGNPTTNGEARELFEEFLNAKLKNYANKRARILREGPHLLYQNGNGSTCFSSLIFYVSSDNKTIPRFNELNERLMLVLDEEEHFQKLIEDLSH